MAAVLPISRGRLGRTVASLTTAAAVFGLVGPALAQDAMILDRPSDRPPALPAFPEAEPALPKIRTPLPLPTQTPEAPGQEGRFQVQGFRYEGNTLLSNAELDVIASAYLDRSITLADVEALRDEITLAYVNRGYVSSGAAIPDQNLERGTLWFQITEGTLASVRIENDGRYREGTLASRFAGLTGEVVDRNALEARIRRLHRDPRIRKIDAQLVPGQRPGESVLELRVEEESPWRLGAAANNYRSPIIGAEGGVFTVAHLNVLGLGDELFSGYTVSAGLHEISGRYAIPVSRFGTTLDVHGQYYRSVFVESIGGNDLSDFQVLASTTGLTLHQPLWQGSANDIDVFLTADYRRARSSIGSVCIAFSSGDCLKQVLPLRFGLQWTRRGDVSVFAFRSMISWGIDVFDDTPLSQSSLPAADDSFIAWLAQIQWARRTGWFDSVFLIRTDLQIASDPLFSMEQFATGGAARVRGYRENTVVRDNGVVGSAELRVPVLQRPGWIGRLELSTFVDAGHGWNTGRSNLGDDTLASVGLGLHWILKRFVHARVVWARPLTDVGRDLDQNLQDNGITFSVSIDWPGGR